MNKPLVYIVDDDVELTKILERRFIQYGCHPVTFNKANNLIKAILEQKPKLLLVDLNLGDGLSGFDIIKDVRNGSNADFPILIISGERDIKKIAHGLEIGASDYIVKPPMKNDFEEIISKYISTDYLPSPMTGTFLYTDADKQDSTLKFPIQIESVHPTGMTLVCDHLIKKGTAFYLSGKALAHVISDCERVFVSTISSSVQLHGGKKKYRIQVEINPSQDIVLNKVRTFLDSKFGGRSS